MNEETNEILPALFKDRETFLSSFIDLISSIEPKNFDPKSNIEDPNDIKVISIDADWGYGKTVFKKHLEKKLEDQGFTVFTYDAWKNDYEVDALSSFIRELIPQMIDAIGFDEKSDSKQKEFAQNTILGLNEITKFVTGIDIIHYKKELKEKKEFLDDKIKQDSDIKNYIKGSPFEKMQNIFKERLNKVYDEIKKVKVNQDKIPGGVSPGRDKKIVVLIDELDRCRPTFAVELLERVKHLFDTGKYLFIFTVCEKQLNESVRQIYGNSYEENGYFRRFFDYEFLLPNPNIKNYFQLSRDQLHTFYEVEIIHSCFYNQDISLRDCEKINKFISLMYRLKNNLNEYELFYITFCIFLKFVTPRIFKDIYYTRNIYISNLEIKENYKKELDKISKSFIAKELNNKNVRSPLFVYDWIHAFIRLKNIKLISNENLKVLYFVKNNINSNIFFPIQVSNQSISSTGQYTYFIDKEYIDLSVMRELILFGINQTDASK